MFFKWNRATYKHVISEQTGSEQAACNSACYAVALNIHISKVADAIVAKLPCKTPVFSSRVLLYVRLLHM